MKTKRSIHHRFLCAILIFLVAFTLPGEAFSQTPTRVLVTPTQSTATTCDDVQIAIAVENVTNLTGYSLQVSFEPGSLTILEVSNGGFLEDGLFEPSNGFNNTTGRISFGMVQQNSIEAPMTPKSGSGNLILIKLRAPEAGQTVPITIDPAASVLVNWPDVEAIPFTVENGTIVTQSCSPSSISLSNLVVAENRPAGTPVGKLITEAPDLDHPFTYTLVDDALYPGNQFFTIDGDQLITSAELNYETKDSHTIKVRSTDRFGQYVEKVFTIAVTDENDSPVIKPIGDQTIDEESLLMFTVTAIDEDRPPDPLTFSLSGDFPSGAAITPEGVFTWTPTEAQGPGQYTFTIRVSDGTAEDSETITITVNEVNRPPTADDQFVTTAEDTSKDITLTARDVEATTLVWTVVTPPAHGVLSGKAPAITYTPAEDYAGPDSFTFKVNDGELDSNTATVSITVSPVNDAPLALADAYSVQEDKVLVVDAPGVLNNDRDVDGDELTAVLDSGPENGKLTLNPDGSFTYTPDPGFFGADSFVYHASDGVTSSGAAEVIITVTKGTERYRIYLPFTPG